MLRYQIAFQLRGAREELLQQGRRPIGEFHELCFDVGCEDNPAIPRPEDRLGVPAKVSRPKPLVHPIVAILETPELSL